MHARSALFDLYGDHLAPAGWSRARGRARAPAGPARASPPRRCGPRSRGWCGRAGWRRCGWPDGPGYALTPRAVRRLDDAAARIYRTQRVDAGTAPGTCWSPTCRPSAAGATGCGPAWPSSATPSSTTPPGSAPAGRPRSTPCSRPRGCGPTRFTARHDGDSLGAGPPRLGPRGAGPGVRAAGWPTPRSWSLRHGPDPDDEQAFAARSRLVHEWRKFLFLDPGCPASCCRRTGPATGPPTSSTPRAAGCCRRPPGSSTPACRPDRLPLPHQPAPEDP